MDQVQEEEYFLSASNEEVIEVQYLLVESQNHIPSMDGVLGFHMENQEKCMTNIDFSGKFEGGPHFNATEEREDREQLKILDGMLPEAQAGHLQAANGIFTTSEDYLIDVGFAKDVANIDYDSHLGNSGSDSQISRFSSGVNGILDSSSTPVPECQNNLVEKTICELNRNVNSKCEFGTLNEAKWLKCSTSYVSQNVEKLEDVSNLLVKGVSSDNEKDSAFTLGLSCSEMSYSTMIVQNKGEKVHNVIFHNVETEGQSVQDVITESSAQDSNVCARFTQKRLRKPTLRYIDESSDQNSRYSRKRREIFSSTSKSRCEISTSTSKGKSLEVRHLNHRHMGSWTTDESFSKAIQVPFDSKGREERRKKRAFIEVQRTDVETSPDQSKCDSAKTIISEEDGGQRKHHKLWTISEVMKLIDGVSEYGVGRWTQIKRLLFSSSVHRTPVDLKDKWRNLLKASCAEEQSKKENEKRRNQPWRPLPKSMLRRVSELAMIYPCPRDDKSKLSHARHAFSPSHAARRTSNPLHISRRIVHRKTVLE